ncbi:protein of unknown function (plasmid) [Cupriavidus taiwanensis]|uniref:Uncharacterized protein n=1 Tax=Cupriavidus taiwanensis TaxID=164546 RepID=A0A375FL24_9BURK|nr:protein of unknown function [Cupriavidus taiwanensis]SOZ72112.1 protein of unknown function [Cupriavidus taiwanensis]SOZ74404.1 protein of unknown function [Cupriavidus taiwanensis]SPA03310.1 protein of unknown function [Cupriavidus taiwanensis]SPA11285.1 protein of unknown function [Cupriavidus taiwanensis]
MPYVIGASYSVATNRIAAVAGHVVAGPLNATELLGVDVRQVTRSGVFIAHDGLAWQQIGEPGQASVREHPADSGFGNTNTAGDLPLEHLPLAPLENQLGLGWVNGPRGAARPGRVSGRN